MSYSPCHYRLLEDQLQKAEKDLKKRETDYTNEIHELQKENDKQQKIIAKVGIDIASYNETNVCNYEQRF